MGGYWYGSPSLLYLCFLARYSTCNEKSRALLIYPADSSLEKILRSETITKLHRLYRLFIISFSDHSRPNRSLFFSNMLQPRVSVKNIYIAVSLFTFAMPERQRISSRLLFRSRVLTLIQVNIFRFSWRFFSKIFHHLKSQSECLSKSQRRTHSIHR